MPNTRRIPQIDALQYMKEHPGDNNAGAVKLETEPQHGRIRIEMYNCATFLDAEESHEVLTKLLRVAGAQFGDGWRAKAKAYIGGDHA